MTKQLKIENKPDRLQSQLNSFAAHIRDPENQAGPAGVEDRRMDIYRQLFFNNISIFIRLKKTLLCYVHLTFSVA